MSITKTGSPNPVDAGQPLTWTLTVHNAGPADAQAVVVTDVLPAGVTFVSATSPNGTCTDTAGEVRCDLGTLADGASVTITIDVTVSPDIVLPSPLSNTATVASDTSDPDTGNNSATSEIVVGTAADVSITKTGSPSPAIAGGPLTWTLKVTNIGPSDAEAVMVTDVLPAGVTLVPNTLPADCSNAAGKVTCKLGTMNVGATIIFTISVTVSPSLGSGVLANTATVSSTTPDLKPANNPDTATTPISLVANLRIVKTLVGSGLTSGQQASYTLAVTNLGPSNAAPPVTVTDVLPAGLSFVSATGTGWGCLASSTAVACVRLTSIAAGTTTTITLEVLVTATSGQITNTATVRGTTPQTDPSGNSQHHEPGQRFAAGAGQFARTG